MPLFSIIIPVYNVASYLRECLDSVLGQTFTDWEGICVDDGSIDGSGAILDEYAAKDKRFMVIHQKNAGVSAARNAAMELMTGKWFLFLDGDDILRTDALSTIGSCIDEASAVDGILVQPSIPWWNGSEIPEKKVKTRILIEKATKEDLFLGPNAANGFPFSRIYKREVFAKLRFPEGMKMAEDVCFWFDALCLDARWTILNAEYYLYRQRADSVCGSKNPHLCVQGLESVLHALRCIDRCLSVHGDEKLRYLRRFPYAVVHNLNLAIERRDELADREWQEIKDKAGELEKLAGCCPFGPWLKLKLRFADSRRWRGVRSLLIACEKAYRHLRRTAGFLYRTAKRKRELKK